MMSVPLSSPAWSWLITSSTSASLSTPTTVKRVPSTRTACPMGSVPLKSAAARSLSIRHTRERCSSSGGRRALPRATASLSRRNHAYP